MEPTAGQRILASLKALAIGDAIGKQTETLSAAGILRWYPNGVRGFEGPPGTPVPRFVGNRKREWKIGETTDDTEQTIAVARAILRDGSVQHASVGRELLQCTKCVHPGVPSLWEFHEVGDPSRVAGTHDGCGAAIRVAPVGILYRSNRLDELVTAAREASVSTHGGAIGIAAAAATAAAVSAAVDAADAPAIIDLAQHSARLAESARAGEHSSTFARAIDVIYRDLSGRSTLRHAEIAAEHFPSSPLTIVPLALTLGALAASVREAVLLATNIGGDSDSVASIAGAVVGARRPGTVVDEWYETVEIVNGHDLPSIARALSRLRG